MSIFPFIFLCFIVCFSSCQHFFKYLLLTQAFALIFSPLCVLPIQLLFLLYFSLFFHIVFSSLFSYPSLIKEYQRLIFALSWMGGYFYHKDTFPPLTRGGLSHKERERYSGMGKIFFGIFGGRGVGTD